MTATIPAPIAAFLACKRIAVGEGSVSPQALQACRERGVEPIEGGCPLMYNAPVDLGHRFFRWWLRQQHRVPG